jgi:hypothetical protein
MDRPLVVISVFLFGKPAWEIERLEGSDVDHELLDQVASCGQELGKRLARVSEVGKKLLEKGWAGSGGLYDIDFHKAISLKDAEAELRAMGIQSDEVTVREETEDGDELSGD